MVMKLINSKLINKKKFNPIAVLVLGVFLLSGCAVGYLRSSTYDPRTGKTNETVYSPLFSTDSSFLAEGAEFRVSVVITRRVEPITYSLLSAMGGLTPDDMISKATAVVHFKNDSQQIYTIHLKKLVVLNEEFLIKVPVIVLRPGDRFSTKAIPVKAPTYDSVFPLKLFYALDGESFDQDFSMHRQKMEDLKRR